MLTTVAQVRYVNSSAHPGNEEDRHNQDLRVCVKDAINMCIVLSVLCCRVEGCRWRITKIAITRHIDAAPWQAASLMIGVICAVLCILRVNVRVRAQAPTADDVHYVVTMGAQ
jgi:hypothetical protein